MQGYMIVNKKHEVWIANRDEWYKKRRVVFEFSEKDYIYTANEAERQMEYVDHMFGKGYARIVEVY